MLSDCTVIMWFAEIDRIVIGTDRRQTTGLVHAATPPVLFNQDGSVSDVKIIDMCVDSIAPSCHRARNALCAVRNGFRANDPALKRGAMPQAILLCPFPRRSEDNLRL